MATTGCPSVDYGGKSVIVSCHLLRHADGAEEGDHLGAQHQHDPLAI